MFGATLKPKYHHMVHYPEKMFMLGPLKHIWAMRCESLHCLLKSTDLTNKKNILKTTSIKETFRMAKSIKHIEPRNDEYYKKGQVVFLGVHNDFHHFFKIKDIKKDESGKTVFTGTNIWEIFYDTHFDSFSVLIETNIQTIDYKNDYKICKLFYDHNKHTYVI